MTTQKHNRSPHANDAVKTQASTSPLPSLIVRLLEAQGWARWLWRDDLSAPPAEGPMPDWLVAEDGAEPDGQTIAFEVLAECDDLVQLAGFLASAANPETLLPQLLRLRADLKSLSAELDEARADARSGADEVARLREDLLDARQWAWGERHRWLFNVDLDHTPAWLTSTRAPIPLDLPDDMLPLDWTVVPTQAAGNA